MSRQRRLGKVLAEGRKPRKSLAEEIERCANRSQWVRDLRASLTPTTDKEPKT